jgi:hypothetical protein
MKSPLRSLAVFIAGPLSFVLCAAVPAAIQSQSLSAVAQTKSPAGQSTTIYPAATAETPGTIIIPGPLRSFMRMAGISQEVATEDVLALLARNVFLHGRVNGKDTEYLVLVDRYLQVARQLQRLADPDGTIRVTDCNDASKLIHALGYKFEHGCNRKSADLITADAERAFLTVDSGFPLTALEEALQKGMPFSYAFPATPVPMLFSEKDWYAVSAWKRQAGGNLLDIILHDPDIDHLYFAMASSDPQTRLALYRSPGLKRLATVAEVFDFYGSKMCIRSGAVVVPAGAAATRIGRISWERVRDLPENLSPACCPGITAGWQHILMRFPVLARRSKSLWRKALVSSNFTRPIGHTLQHQAPRSVCFPEIRISCC